jgi:hypothetical protein
MRHLVKEGLGLESRVIVQRPLLTNDAQEMRKERCQKLINNLKANQPLQVRIFSDEKIFTVDVAINRRNSRYLTDLRVADVDPDVRISPKSKAPLKQMVLGVIGNDGQKCPIIFVSAGERVNADVYQDLFQKHVIPWIKRTYPDGYYVFEQDSAPAHTAQTTQQFLRETMAEFWTPADWPPYSPDLNSLDFLVWRVVQEKVQATPYTSLAALRQSITRQWNRMSPAYVRRTCRSFCRNLEACRGEKWRLYKIDRSSKDQDTPISPFQGYQKLP